MARKAPGPSGEGAEPSEAGTRFAPMQKKPANTARASRPALASPPALAQAEATITLVRAARKYGCGAGTLRTLVDRGAIGYLERRLYRGGESLIFDVAQLQRDLAGLPHCHVEGCDEPALSPSGYCPAHRYQVALQAMVIPSVGERDWYTQEEAAKAAHVTSGTIIRARAKGELEALRKGKHIRIFKAALDEWSASRRGRGTSRCGKRLTAEQLGEDRRVVEALHGQKATRAKIAEALGCSLPTVDDHLEALGLKPPRRPRGPRLSPQQRAALDKRICERYVSGDPMAEIEREEGCSAPRIHDACKRLGVPLRPSGKPAKGPPVAARLCPGCGKEFTPPWPSAGEQSFCKYRCMFDARAKAWRSAAEERGLLLTQDVAKGWKIGRARVLQYITSGDLQAERIALPGYKRIWGVSLEEVKRFEREWARGKGRDNPQRLRYLDPDQAIARLKATGGFDKRLRESPGLTPEQLETLITADATARSKLLASHRRGRKPAGHHERWIERFEFFKLEQQATYDRDLGLKLAAGPLPKNYSAARAVFEEDWPEHPELWPREAWPASPENPGLPDPKMLRAGAKRILSAVNGAQQRSAAA